jgi:hypothetical protein
MTGSLAQLIAIVAYGNQSIASGKHSDFFPNNSTFQFCNAVVFTKIQKRFFFSKSKAVTVAENPTAWFKLLVSEGCTGLKLYYEGSGPGNNNGVMDHKLAGMIGGGGTWLIEAMYQNYSDFWYGDWQVNRQEASDNRIWSVNYKPIHNKILIRNIQSDPEAIRTRLSTTLSEIEDFAYETGQENFASVFHLAKDCLTDPNPEKGFYHTDLLPEHIYGLKHRQLLISASRAWVFGGMGSWNDMGFEDESKQERYDALSSQLYSDTNNAILATINSK